MSYTGWARFLAAGIPLAIFVVACGSDNEPALIDPGSGLERTAGSGVNQSTTTQHNEGRMRLEGQLFGSIIEPRASGRARWERRPDRTRFETEVEDLITDGRYSVRVNDVYIASFIVVGGRGEVERDSRDSSRIPMMQVGDIVTVLNPGGDIALIGHLRPD